jgi:flavin-dependent dehydrogenase
MRNVDVLIVGAGPAGMSTALHLARRGVGWPGRIVVLEKARHPRDKLCGGAISRAAMNILTSLDLTFSLPSVTVNELRIAFGGESSRIPGEAILRIARRDEFDHWLVRCGEERGIEVRQGEGVTAVLPQPDGVRVVTGVDTYAAKMLVAADGSNSFVKRQLNWETGSRIARLLEVLTPVDPAESLEFREGAATFDFSPLARGLQGYYWDFPSLVQGAPTMNRGVFDSRVNPNRPRISLKDEFARQLALRGIELADCDLRGHPLHWFDVRAEFSRPHVLLVGDAAGTDALLGEGIPFALGYGKVAADEIAAGWQTRDWRLATYKARILEDPLLKQLRSRTLGARFLHLLPQRSWSAAELGALLATMLNGTLFGAG